MFCRNIIAFICIFVAAAIATVHNDSHSTTGSDAEVTVHPLTTENPESSSREPEQQVVGTVAVDRLAALSDPQAETRTPAPADSGATPATQPDRDHSDPSGLTPASAAPTTAARHTPTPDNATLWNLTAEEKGSRLIEAAKEGAVEEVDALLAAGADVRARDVWNRTALHWAASLGHVEAARRLLAAGAEVEAKSNSQFTPLHEAAGYGHTAVVRLLVGEASADTNATDDDGWTPLHWAAFNGEAEAAAALLQAGANRGATDKDGGTALDIARANNHQQLIDVLTPS